MGFLELTGIQKRFGTTAAVEDFNLVAERGEFISFLGPSGCGKTTTLRMIAGFERPTEGRILIDGVDVTDRAPNKRDVGMVFQSYALFPNMTVADNIGFGLKVRKRSDDQIKKRVVELLDIVNLPEKGKRYPYQLSGGQQQRVALARALAFEPQVLLLDEPLSALDAKIRVALRVEIRSIQRQLGITTVYVTHDQEEALSLSDRVVVMSEGRMEQVGTPFEIYNFPSTAFVASFVGTLNVLRGSVTDAAKGELTIAGQPVRIARAFEGSLGREVTVALRPEMVSLGSDAAGGENRLTGKVTDVSFLGSIVRFRISLGDGGPIVILDEFNEPTLKLPQIGETATISFPADGPLVLDAKAPVESVEALIAEKLSRTPAPGVLDGIDLLIFDKDGTLIEFHRMWGAWVDELASRLEAASGLPLRAGLYPLLGVDPATGFVQAHGLMAATPMSRIREVVERFVDEAGIGPGRAAAAVEAAWHAPDPVGLARPVTDLGALFARLRPRVATFAVATSDDRIPTERTLEALGIADAMAGVVCADDGVSTKPAPDPVLHLCRLLGVPPDRTAVVGDSPADLRMGRSAGAARSIGVLTGVGDRAALEPLADVVLGSIAELAPA